MEWISIKSARPNKGVLVGYVTREGKAGIHRYNEFGFSDSRCWIGGTKYSADVANKRPDINPDDWNNDFGVTHWFPFPFTPEGHESLKK